MLKKNVDTYDICMLLYSTYHLNALEPVVYIFLCLKDNPLLSHESGRLMSSHISEKKSNESKQLTNAACRMGIVGLLLVVGLTQIGSADVVKMVVNYMKENQNVQWVNLERSSVAFGAIDEDQTVVKMKKKLIDSGEPKVGIIEADALFMKARPIPGKIDYGVMGEKVLTLPNQPMIQFQGGGEILKGLEEGAELHLQLATPSEKGDDWVVQEVFKPRRNSGYKKEYPGLCHFKVDLSDWAGMEVKLSLVLRVYPTYTKVGSVEKWTPNEISANWYRAEVVSVPFKVIVGKPKPVNEVTNERQGKVNIDRRNIDKDTTNGDKNNESEFKIKLDFPPADVYNDFSDQKIILKGNPNGTTPDDCGFLANPFDFPITTVNIPSTPPFFPYTRHLCYFTARRSMYHTEYYASTGYPVAITPTLDQIYGAGARVIDFATSASYNMYNSSATAIRNNMVKDGNGNAVQVLAPSGDASRNFDDHWVGISSIIYSRLSDSSKALHAFFNGEDHFYDILQDCDQFYGPTNPRGATCEEGLRSSTDEFLGSIYWSIGYARSTENQGSNFGHSFTKMTSYHSGQSVLPIITLDVTQNQCDYGLRTNFGTGDPSVILIGDYYYMLYAAHGPREFNNSDQLYRWDNGYERVGSCDGYNEEDCGHLNSSVVTIARALRSDVISTNYSNSNNPWKKYNYVNGTWDSSANWVEPGIGGAYSGVWNTNSNNRDQMISYNEFRVNPKMSRNTYLSSEYGIEYLFIARGGTTFGGMGIFLHFAEDNPVDWDDASLLLENAEIDEGGTTYRYSYPTIIGTNGLDNYQTSMSNYIYFKKHVEGQPAGDLIRCSLIFF